MRILIAEDNSTIAMAMATGLETAGHTVVGPAVANAPALAAARASPPDLALVDIDLQGGDSGFDLAERLNGELGVPCLFVTGQLGEAIAHEAGCREGGARPCAALGALGKPFRIAVLLEAVEQALAYAKGGGVPESGGRQLRWFGRG